MAPTSSSHNAPTSRPTVPIALKRQPAANVALLADIVSFGFVLTAIVAVTAYNMHLGVLQVLAVMAIFGALRYVAHELRLDADRATLVDARRIANLRAQSPRRWSVEQRDGLGRRVDTRS